RRRGRPAAARCWSCWPRTAPRSRCARRRWSGTRRPPARAGSGSVRLDAPAPSSRRVRAPRRRAAAYPGSAPRPAPAATQSVRVLESSRVLDRFADLLVDRAGVLQRLGGLGRHVVLVVLGQHLARDEDAVLADLALGHHAFALLEQVGQDAVV